MWDGMKLMLADKVITSKGRFGTIVATKKATKQYGVAYGDFLIGLEWFSEDELTLSGVRI